MQFYKFKKKVSEDTLNEKEIKMPVKKFKINIGGIKASQILSTIETFQENLQPLLKWKIIKKFQDLIELMLNHVENNEPLYRQHQGESIAACVLLKVVQGVGTLSTTDFLDAFKPL